MIGVGRVFGGIRNRSAEIILGLLSLEAASFAVVLGLGAMGVTFPLSFPWQVVAVPAFLILVGGPLYLALWFVGRRSKEARRGRDVMAMLVAIAHVFLTAATVAVFLVAPISA